MVNYSLVEKILDTYINALVHNRILQVSSSNTNNGGSFHSSTSSASKGFVKELPVLSHHQLETLKVSAALWYLQQGLLALNLAKEFSITYRELFAIFGIFSTYDTTLSNEIFREDLYDLLQVS